MTRRVAPADIRIGTAGWSIPRLSAARFEPGGTHLERYARRLRAAEINSSFHRPHSAATYAKWRDRTPPDFRFAVKLPRTITHDLQLRRTRALFLAFADETEGLAEKRGPLLVQLPPSLSFDAGVASRFFRMVRARYRGPLVCEPRHATWFAPAASALLERYQVARVAADPAVVAEAAVPGGWSRLVYVRLHGSPRTYWSRYEADRIAQVAATIRSSRADAAWCVFDNTASGAAIDNACELHEALAATGTLRALGDDGM
jgi:uncharacterized protein YecE (DUF72 family)